jgi:tRNA(fMet)-specific endonuclease VapC
VSGEYLLDTNIVVALWRGDKSVVEKIEVADTVYVPVIVIGELMYGAYHSDRLESDLVRIHRQIERSALLHCDEHVATHYGQIKALLRKKGRPIPDNDIWIAAVAQHHTLTLVSRDPHFAEIDQLDVEEW